MKKIFLATALLIYLHPLKSHATEIQEFPPLLQQARRHVELAEIAAKNLKNKQAMFLVQDAIKSIDLIKTTNPQEADELTLRVVRVYFIPEVEHEFNEIERKTTELGIKIKTVCITEEDGTIQASLNIPFETKQ